MGNDNAYMQLYMQDYRRKWQKISFEMIDIFAKHADELKNVMSGEEMEYFAGVYDEVELAKKRMKDKERFEHHE